MKPVSIDLKSLRNGGYIEYIRDYLYVFEQNDPVAMMVEDEFNALTANLYAIELVFKQDRASDLTEVIANLDIQRDQYLVGIGLMADAYLRHYDESKVQDAKKLKHHLDVYGSAYGIAMLPLQQQSATVSNLVYDLQNDTALSAAVTALQLTDWVSQLQLVNENLRDAYRERTEEKGAAPADKIKDLRVEGYGLYYQLRDMMMAQALISGYISPYDTVINETNALAEQYNDMLARRSGSGSNPEEEGDDDVGDNPEV